MGSVREELIAALTGEGYKVEGVSNAAEAINTITLQRPGLILLELSFPEPAAHVGGVAWDSFLVISWAGRFGAGSTIPFIALATKDAGRARDRDQALEFGAMDYLPSPLQTEELVKAVYRAFELASVA